MEKIWLKSYPEGVPAEIDPNQYRSLKEMWEEGFSKFGSAIAYTNMDVNLTYSQIEEASRVFGAWLQNEAGLKKGDRVALMMPNVLQYPIAIAGVLRAGMTVVNTNPLYTARELEHQLKDSGAKVILILENFAHVLAEVIGKTDVQKVILTSVGDMLGFPKGAIVNFVLRRVRKQVPAYNLPGALRWKDVIASGTASHAQAGGSRPR